MKKFLSLALILLALSACDEKPQEKPPLPKDTLAAVGGSPITQTDFEERVKELDPEFQKFVKTVYGRENFLNFLINEQVLIKAAQENGIPRSDEFKKEMEEIKKQQEIALKEKEEYLLNKLLMEKLEKDGTIAVSDQEIRAYHKRYPYQITVAHILLNDPVQAAAVMRRVGNIKTQSGFEEMVRTFSTDPETKKNGGKLPPFIPGEYLPEIEVPAANSPAFSPQGFIKTPFGFHIIMKIKEESLSYNNAKERIKKILEKQKLDAYLESLRSKYTVEVIDEGK